MIIETPNVIEGTAGPLRFAGVPVAGTSEIQTLTFGGTWIAAETFKLAFEGFSTAPITWSATNATLVANIDAALEALPNIGLGGITTATGTMTSGIGTITVAFAGNLAKKPVATIAVAQKSSASGTLAVAETTPGVAATGRGASTGATLQDTTNGVSYVNSGTPLSPTWTKVGTQS